MLFRCLTSCLPASELLLKCAKAQQVESQALSRIVASAPTTASWPWYNAMQMGPVESSGYTWKQVAILAGGSGAQHDRASAFHIVLGELRIYFRQTRRDCGKKTKAFLVIVNKAVKLVLIQLKKETWI